MVYSSFLVLRVLVGYAWPSPVQEGERDPEEDVVYQSVVAGPEIVQQIGEEWYLPVWSVGPDQVR